MDADRLKELEVAERLQRACAAKVVRRVDTTWLESVRSPAQQVGVPRKRKMSGLSREDQREAAKRETALARSRAFKRNTDVLKVVTESGMSANDITQAMGGRISLECHLRSWMRGEVRCSEKVLLRIEAACSSTKLKGDTP